MDILMVLSGEKSPPNTRVKHKAQNLIGAGHILFLMARKPVLNYRRCSFILEK